MKTTVDGDNAAGRISSMHVIFAAYDRNTNNRAFESTSGTMDLPKGAWTAGGRAQSDSLRLSEVILAHRGLVVQTNVKCQCQDFEQSKCCLNRRCMLSKGS